MARKFKKKNGRSTKNEVDKKEFEGETPSRSNDPAWYTVNSQLLMDAANINFSNAVGTRYNLGFATNTDGLGTTVECVPGIQTFDIVPCPAGYDAPNSPINIASTALYSFVRHANAGSANYDSPDLMMYAIAMANVYSYINWLIRIYGCVQLYSHGNRYMPRALVLSQGVDFDDIERNLADYRYMVNILIHKAASLACPATMPYFRRLAFLFSGVYSEGDSVKSQLYMYVPKGFMRFSELNPETIGSTLTFAPIQPDFTNVPVQYVSTESLYVYGLRLLNPILSSESMNIMSGDILKAYGADNLLRLAPLDENYMLIPTPDLNVLEQMQNMDIFSTEFVPTIEEKRVSTNDIETYLSATAIALSANLKPAELYAVQNQYKRHLLTTILVNPNAEDVIERTRLMGTVHPTLPTVPGNVRNYTLNVCSEYCVGSKLWSFANKNNLSGQPLWDLTYTTFSAFNATYSDSDLADLRGMLFRHTEAENFKFHPKMFYYASNETAADTSIGDVYYQWTAVDIDNYAIISENDIEQMNEEALLALMNVQSVARY